MGHEALEHEGVDSGKNAGVDGKKITDPANVEITRVLLKLFTLLYVVHLQDWVGKGRINNRKGGCKEAASPPKSGSGGER
ncbi:MAG: hypothetical protein ACOX5Z_07775 [Desulfobulbus sp.]|jgi:hypothetical protein